MVGDGQNVTDFTYVENVVYAHILARRRLTPGSVCAGRAYFITNGEPKPFWEFINSILSELGCVGPTKTISFSVAYSLAALMVYHCHHRH
jgi:nucleoside-diphosphate-sugar epimerase